MVFLPILDFLLWFYLFAASSGLTYLSLRAWGNYGSQWMGNRRWRENRWIHAIRALGFACLTLPALIGAVNDYSDQLVQFKYLSLSRILGYFIVILTTPARLRRQKLVTFGFMMLVLGEALLYLQNSGALPKAFYPEHHMPPLPLVAIAFMDIGATILWRRFARTVLSIRLNDKFTLAFSMFSAFSMLLVTVSIVALIEITIRDSSMGISLDVLGGAFRSLDRPLILVFVMVVVGSAIVSYFLAHNLIEPVNRMASALRAIGRGELGHRLHGIRSRDEIQELAREINDMAQRLTEADELRAEFVSFASHELRNPLTAVKGFIETLHMVESSGQDGMALEERMEIYEIVRSECERMLRMTNELLDTSRVESGRPVVLSLEMIDLRQAIQKVVSVMRLHTRKHELVALCPESPVMASADRDKIEQIVINLLSNAIKYSPDGGLIEIIVTENESTVEIAVHDHGLGMTEEQAEKVFDKFYRIHEGGKPASIGKKGSKAPGAGLGLYLTRALVIAHGGNIRVESVQDEGSTFTVTLPRTELSYRSGLTGEEANEAIAEAAPMLMASVGS